MRNPPQDAGGRGLAPGSTLRCSNLAISDADRGPRADAYPLSLQRGQTLIVHAGTEAFRPTLPLIGPSGYIGHVDGWEDTPSLASFTCQAEQSGRYTLLVSTVGLEDAGGYLVRMRVPAE